MHLNGFLASDWVNVHTQSLTLSTRVARNIGNVTSENAQAQATSKRSIALAVTIGVLGLALAASFVACVVRNKHKSQRAIVETKRRRPSAWERIQQLWHRRRKPDNAYQAAPGEDGSHHSHQLTPAPTIPAPDVEQAPNPPMGPGGSVVDRHASVRSVLTLPAYRVAAAHNEQVLGREGERDGIDTVIEFPTEQDEEDMREDEMNAMYQLRQTRRQHNEQRAELRRLRREAERRGDSRTVALIRSRDRAASSSNNNVVGELQREIERARETRHRAVSSVSYAALGVARHDGTRVRGNSQESDRRGLLSDVADISALSIRSGQNSPAFHERQLSGSSIGSFDIDFPFPSPAYTRSRSESRPATPPRVFEALPGSSPVLGETDLGLEAMPPPEYEEIPLYDGHVDDAENSIRNSHGNGVSGRNINGEGSNTINEGSTNSHVRVPTSGPLGAPPGYSGRHDDSRSSPEQTQYGQGLGLGLTTGSMSAVDTAATSTNSDSTSSGRTNRRSQSVIPQLPSLRLGRLPEIRIDEPFTT